MSMSRAYSLQNLEKIPASFLFHLSARGRLKVFSFVVIHTDDDNFISL